MAILEGLKYDTRQAGLDRIRNATCFADLYAGLATLSGEVDDSEDHTITNEKILETLKQHGVYITSHPDHKNPKWMITDTNGFGGPVYQAKEMLKGFFGIFHNGCWLVPKSKATLEELYIVLSPNLTDETLRENKPPKYDFSVVSGDMKDEVMYEDLLKENNLVIRHEWSDDVIEIHDKTFKGPLYQAREDIKNIFKGKFEKDSRGKGWWIIPAEDGVMHMLYIVLSQYFPDTEVAHGAA